MKKRYWILLGIAVGFALIALLLSCLRAAVTKDDRRDFAAERFRGKSEEKYMQLAVYPSAEAGCTADWAMATKYRLADALRAESLEPDGHMLFCASTERPLTASYADRSTEVTATVYFGDFFGLHPEQTVAGGYPMESSVSADWCVIDDLAAWRLFGSSDVCGMEVEINGRYYTVTTVLRAVRNGYEEYYGQTPRIYVRYDSALFRDSDIAFTSVEGILPDPVEDFAKGIFETAVGDLGKVYAYTGRFSASALFENCKRLTTAVVMEGEDFPYEENIARIREAKCTYLFLGECVCLAVAALSTLCILLCAWHDLQAAWEAHRRKKNTHAIID